MKTIQVPAIEKISDESKTLLVQVQKRIGKLPNLYAVIGYSSPALKMLLDSEATLSQSISFTPKEKEAINLIVSQMNNCAYCLAAHTVLAKFRGFTQEEIIAIRKAEYREAKLNNVLQLIKSMIHNKGEADEKLLDEFYQNGYDEKALIEIIALTCLRSFTNFVYSNTKVPIDFPAVESV